MLVTITETFKQGTYLKSAVTSIDGCEIILGLKRVEGSRLLASLGDLTEGMNKVTIVESNDTSFKMKGILTLEKVIPSNQIKENVA